MTPGWDEGGGGVVVVGGGPVGMISALALAREGVPVTVLEAGPGILDEPRAIVYHPPAVEALANLGLGEDLHEVGLVCPVLQRRDLREGYVSQIDYRVLSDITPFPYSLHLGQHDLAAIVLGHLREMPNFRILWKARVTRIAQDGDGVAVRFETPEGDGETLRCSWLVGADGAGSAVRKLVGVAFEGFTWPDRFVATNVLYDFESHGYAESNLVADPDDWCVVSRIDKTPNLWRIAYGGEDPELSEEAVLARVHERHMRMLPDPSAPYELVHARPYRVHERVSETYRVGRVLLAGDAAHVNNPLGGYGLNTGIHDAIDLGSKLSAVWRGEEDGSLLDVYADQRRMVALEATQVMATRNKRTVEERDPEKRRQYREMARRVGADPELARKQVLTAWNTAVTAPEQIVKL